MFVFNFSGYGLGVLGKQLSFTNECSIFEPLSSWIVEWLIDGSFLALTQTYAMLSYMNAFRLRFWRYNICHGLGEQIIGISRIVVFRSMDNENAHSKPVYKYIWQLEIYTRTWEQLTTQNRHFEDDYPRMGPSIKHGGTEARVRSPSRGNAIFFF
jgi:hypothetical protein